MRARARGVLEAHQLDVQRQRADRAGEAILGGGEGADGRRGRRPLGLLGSRLSRRR